MPSADRHLTSYLEESVLRFPERPAVFDQDGSSLTFAELHRRSDRLAEFLVEKGVKPGDRVGIVMAKSLISYTLLWSVIKCGAAYVPVDWTNPPERVAQILADCGVRLILADPESPDLSEVVDESILMDAAAFEAAANRLPTGSLPTSRSADDLVFLLYTSGSSGIPKGVMSTHVNVTSLIEWAVSNFGGTEEDRFANHAPFHFALSVLNLFTPIKLGGSVHLIPTELGKDPRALAAFIAERKLTVWFSTPAILRLLAEFGNLHRFDFSSLRIVKFAGEAFQIPSLRKLTELWPTTAFFNAWGSTETNLCCYREIPKPIPTDRTDPYPIGFPGDHCRVVALDDAGNQVAPGTEGIMHISGPSVFLGYWGLEPSNFVYRDGARWHNTGDVVRELADEGFVYVGRRDRMIKRSGFRVELAEVERALLRHSALAEVAIIAVPDRHKNIQIVANLVSRSEPRPTIIECKTHCSQHLPHYMNPDRFVFHDALPRTSSNKVDYQTLVRQYEETCQTEHDPRQA